MNRARPQHTHKISQSCTVHLRPSRLTTGLAMIVGATFCATWSVHLYATSVRATHVRSLPPLMHYNVRYNTRPVIKTTTYIVRVTRKQPSVQTYYDRSNNKLCAPIESTTYLDTITAAPKCSKRRSLHEHKKICSRPEPNFHPNEQYIVSSTQQLSAQTVR